MPSLLLGGAGGPGKFVGTVFFDDFSSSRLAEYTTVGSVSVSSGVLNFGAGSDFAAVTAHSLLAPRVTIKATASTTRNLGIILVNHTGTAMLSARINGATPSNVRVSTFVSNSGELSILSDIAVGAWATGNWLRVTKTGNVILAERWTTDPFLGGSPAGSGTYTLTGAEATLYGAGVSGRCGAHVSGTPSWTADDLRIESL